MVDAILMASFEQGRTCMYSRKELETFPQEKLEAIFTGIIALGKRGPWRKQKNGPPPLKRGRKKKVKT